jgi:hypothetical protein
MLREAFSGVANGPRTEPAPGASIGRATRERIRWHCRRTGAGPTSPNASAPDGTSEGSIREQVTAELSGLGSPRGIHRRRGRALGRTNSRSPRGTALARPSVDPPAKGVGYTRRVGTGETFVHPRRAGVRSDGLPSVTRLAPIALESESISPKPPPILRACCDAVLTGRESLPWVLGVRRVLGGPPPSLAKMNAFVARNPLECATLSRLNRPAIPEGEGGRGTASTSPGWFARRRKGRLPDPTAK